MDSLEQPELWNIAGSATAGVSKVTLTLPNLFTQLATPQAAISFTYKHPDVDQAKDFACRTTLLFALVAGPNLVRLHPSTVRDAARVHEAVGIARAHAIFATTDGQRPWLDAVPSMSTLPLQGRLIRHRPGCILLTRVMQSPQPRAARQTC